MLLLMHQEFCSLCNNSEINFADFTANMPESLCRACVPIVVVWFVGWFCLALLLNRDSLYPGPCNNCEKKTLQKWCRWWMMTDLLSFGSAIMRPLSHHPLWSVREPWTLLGTRPPTSDLTTHPHQRRPELPVSTAKPTISAWTINLLRKNKWKRTFCSQFLFRFDSWTVHKDYYCILQASYTSFLSLHRQQACEYRMCYCILATY